MDKRSREIPDNNSDNQPVQPPRTWLGRVLQEHRDIIIIIFLCIIFVGILLSPVLLFLI